MRSTCTVVSTTERSIRLATKFSAVLGESWSVDYGESGSPTFGIRKCLVCCYRLLSSPNNQKQLLLAEESQTQNVMQKKNHLQVRLHSNVLEFQTSTLIQMRALSTTFHSTTSNVRLFILHLLIRKYYSLVECPTTPFMTYLVVT